MKIKSALLLATVTFLGVFISLFFSGFIDNTTTIEVMKGQKIIFTNERPNPEDSDIVLCVPAAYSGDDGIIGHYSVGNGRHGFADYRYTTIHLDYDSHFQQATLVKNHQPKDFDDSRKRFRRALCKKNGKFSIVHSKLPVTLTAFSKSLTDYDNAWNLDMGSYSYGWYKDKDGLHHLGLSSILNKGKQTNWIIIKDKIR